MPITEQDGREWKNGMFGCLGDFRVCIISFLVPCYAEGKNAEYLGEDCMLVALLAFVGIPFGPVLRWRIRQQKGIKGSMIMDMIYSMFCPCCALAQESQEIGWTLGGNSENSGESGARMSADKSEDMTRQ